MLLGDSLVRIPVTVVGRLSRSMSRQDPLNPLADLRIDVLRRLLSVNEHETVGVRRQRRVSTGRL